MPGLAEEILTRYRKSGLEALICHSTSVEKGTSMASFHDSLREHDHSFVAVISDGGRFAGLLSRHRVSDLLSGRYGYPLFSKRPVESCMEQQYVAVSEGTNLDELLRKSLLKRKDEYFFHDVVLTGENGHYIGLISVRDLVALQGAVSKEHAQKIECQRLMIEERNNTLFEKLDELRASQGQWKSLFSHNPSAIALTDTQGLVVRCNPRFREWFGSHLGTEAYSGFCLTDLVREDQREVFLRQFREGGDQSVGNYEFKFVGKSAEDFRTMRTVFFTIPETCQSAVFLEDITDQRDLEKEIANQEKSAMLDTLIGGIAHELNNKLSPILGFLSLYELGEGGRDDFESAIPIIKEATQDSAAIIRQLLDLSRPPALVRSSRDLKELCESTVSLLQYEAREVDCRIEIDFEGTDSSTFHALFDPGQIRQVLINLIINSIHAVEGRDVREVRIQLRETDTHIKIIIADTGTGIPEQDLSNIFEPFFTTRSQSGGTGLGLSVCRNIVNLHDGELDVSSVLGKGTQFTLQLPTGDASSKSPGAELRPSGDRAQSSFRDLNCLIVDDDSFVATFLSKALRVHLGIRPVTAVNGKVAIEILKKEKFDFVISDVRMPELDGFELHEWIETNLPSLRDRFLFITGDAGGANLEQELQQIESPVLRKPFAVDELSEAFGRLVSRVPAA